MDHQDRTHAGAYEPRRLESRAFDELLGLCRGVLFDGQVVDEEIVHALWLESCASLLTLAVILLALVARIVIEETTLRETLADYAGSMGRVPYRLVPGVW